MPTVKGDSMRGLAVFISDIRNCKSKEAEIKRINKELANIRSKFKGDKTLDGYQKKKYVCKLLFIFLLGHDIDFGHSEAVNLLCSNKYTEKQIGYLFISVLINESHNLMNLVVQRLKDDLSSRNPVFVTLALQCIANIGTREMTEHFAKEIPRLLVSGDTIDSVKQSAALCLLKLIRAAPDLVHFDDWTSRVIHLLNDQHMGVVTAAVSLIESLVKRSPEEYKACVSLAVSRLSRIVTSSYTDLQDYTYYFVPAPWLSVKLLRLLQNYPPPDDAPVRSRLTECLESILSKAQEPPKSKKVQHSNAKNAVLFEAINLIIHMDCDPNLLIRACNQLGQFLSHRETNLRYLALESMCLLATSEFSHEAVKKHQETVISALKSERDVSVRQRAVDLLYAMCDRNNAEEIVGEMLSYLESADYSIREEMVLKVAILSEKYATDYSWYVDTILNLIRVAGDYVSEEVWHRVIQIVINRSDVQGYSAKTVFEALQAPACHENMVKVGGYILGEFGNLIAGDPRSSPQIQFQILHAKYHLCTPATRQLLLSTYVKFINLFPEIKDDIQDILKNDSNLRNADVEIQQRTIEYLTLSKIATDDVMATVLEEMPSFTERESSILAKLKQKKPASIEGQEIISPRQHPTAKISKNPLDTQNDSITAKSDSSTQEVDLLGGLFSPNSQSGHISAKNVTQNTSDLLLDILGNGFESDISENKFSSDFSNPITFEQTGSDENYLKLIWKSSGILFENDKIQIGIKSEFRGNMGRLGIFYGNKSLKQMTEFSSEMYNCPLINQLKLDLNPIKSEIASGDQEQQRLNIECFQAFDEIISLKVFFNIEKQPFKIKLNLPITINKFIESAIMDQSTFFQRWKVLSQPGQECQNVVHSLKCPMELTAIQSRIEGLNLSVLPNIDPVASNFVASGIVNMSSQKVGVLMRLEPNMATKIYRLTVRSTKDMVSRKIFNIIESLL